MPDLLGRIAITQAGCPVEYYLSACIPKQKSINPKAALHFPLTDQIITTVSPFAFELKIFESALLICSSPKRATHIMATKPHNKRLAILDGGCDVEMGPDMMFRHLEEGYDTGPDNIALICTHQS